MYLGPCWHLNLALRLLYLNRGGRANKTKSPESKYKVISAVRVRERNLQHIRLPKDMKLKLNLDGWCKFQYIRTGRGHLRKGLLIVGCIHGARSNAICVDCRICEEEWWKGRPEWSVELRLKKVMNSRFKNVCAMDSSQCMIKPIQCCKVK